MRGLDRALIAVNPDSAGIAFDRLFVANLRLIGIEPVLPTREPLTQEIPALIERPLELAQPLHVILGGTATRLALEEPVLFVRQRIDPLENLFLVHGSPRLIRRKLGRDRNRNIARGLH